MRKRRNRTRLLTQAQEDPNKHNGFIVASEGNNNNNLTIDQEIECPSCHDIMTLCSDFDSCAMYVKNVLSSFLRINHCEL